jgi:hypothetical protein
MTAYAENADVVDYDVYASAEQEDGSYAGVTDVLDGYSPVTDTPEGDALAGRGGQGENDIGLYEDPVTANPEYAEGSGSGQQLDDVYAEMDDDGAGDGDGSGGGAGGSAQAVGDYSGLVQQERTLYGGLKGTTTHLCLSVRALQTPPRCRCCSSARARGFTYVCPTSKRLQ